jgi:uncharacterized damage-inducible protein DinB
MTRTGTEKAPAWRVAVTGQFGAAIDMLENAIRACPDAHWSDDSTPVAQQFWYLAFHTLWWLDCYLGTNEKSFRPPAPYTRDELDPAGIYPERAYTPAELLEYLAHGRRKMRERLAALTEAEAAAPCGFERKPFSTLELLIYGLRHVQHHTAQLNLLLRQKTDSAPRWVGRAKDDAS